MASIVHILRGQAIPTLVGNWWGSFLRLRIKHYLSWLTDNVWTDKEWPNQLLEIGFTEHTCFFNNHACFPTLDNNLRLFKVFSITQHFCTQGWNVVWHTIRTSCQWREVCHFKTLKLISPLICCSFPYFSFFFPVLLPSGATDKHC